MQPVPRPIATPDRAEAVDDDRIKRMSQSEFSEHMQDQYGISGLPAFLRRNRGTK
jgi:hypothetical protein